MWGERPDGLALCNVKCLAMGAFWLLLRHEVIRLACVMVDLKSTVLKRVLSQRILFASVPQTQPTPPQPTTPITPSQTPTPTTHPSTTTYHSATSTHSTTKPSSPKSSTHTSAHAASQTSTDDRHDWSPQRWKAYVDNCHGVTKTVTLSCNEIPQAYASARSFRLCFGHETHRTEIETSQNQCFGSGILDSPHFVGRSNDVAGMIFSFRQ